ncbi:transposase [Burkholderia multivorans]|nr:transposase [Burkholderia multivorans]
MREWQRDDRALKAIGAGPGGELLTTTAAVATMGDARAFRSRHQFAEWAGLLIPNREARRACTGSANAGIRALQLQTGNL